MFTLYGDKISGNCLKALYVANYLGLDHKWVDISVLGGGARTEEFLKINPYGQVPALQTGNGATLAQSNAIMLYLAEASALVPEDPWARAKMNEWLFWEQYSHETAIAVTRFHVVYMGKSIAERDPVLVSKGEGALDRMEAHLNENRWFVGESISLADIALYAYTQFAPDAGFDLKGRPNILGWLKRTASTLDLASG